jgi:hypothetical protein
MIGQGYSLPVAESLANVQCEAGRYSFGLPLQKESIDNENVPFESRATTWKIGP